MAESFNPYADWLGVENASAVPNHYQLFGLPPFIEDQAEIKRAADAQIARIRGIRPGDKAREWSKLLDELREAKRTLTTPDAKQQYDQQLRQGGSKPEDAGSGGAGSQMAAPAPAELEGGPENGGPETGAAPQPVMAAVRNPMPPGFGPPTITQPAAPQAGPAPSTGTTPHGGGEGTIKRPSPLVSPMPSGPVLNPALPVAGPNVPTAGSVSPSVPAPTAGPAIPLAMPVQPGGAGGGHIPLATPVAGPVLPAAGQVPLAGPISPAGGPAVPLGGDPVPLGGGAAVPPGGGPVFGGGAATPIAGAGPASPPLPPDEQGSEMAVVAEKKPLAKRRSTPSAGAIAALLLLIGLVGFGSAYLLKLGPFSEEDPSRIADAGDNGSGDDESPAEGGDPNAGDSETAPGTANGNGDAGDNDHAGSGSDEAPANGTDDFPTPGQFVNGSAPDRGAANGGNGPAGPGEEEMRDPGTAPPDLSPEPEPEPLPELSPEQLAEVNAALRAAREAMSRREFSLADQQLSRAEGIALSGEALEKTQRARLLYQYLMEFWSAVRQTMAGLEGQELELNNTRAFVVESSAESMTMRYLGRNLTFTRDTLPSQLVRLLGERWLDSNDPSSDVFVGAFVAVDPESDAAEARRLWQRALAANVPIAELIPVLDDEY